MFRLGCVIVALVCLTITGYSQGELAIRPMDIQISDSQPIVMVEGSPEILKYLPKSSEILVKDKNQAPVFEWEYRTSGYYFRFSKEYGRLKGCINRDVWHLGVLIRRITPTSSWQIFNGHAAVWSESNWKKCFGIYESVSGFCFARCNATWSEINSAWVDVMVFVGASLVVAKWLAAILTPVTVGALMI